MSNSFLDDIQIEEIDEGGIHILSDTELSDLHDFCEENHVTGIGEDSRFGYWHDFDQINEDDVPF